MRIMIVAALVGFAPAASLAQVGGPINNSAGGSYSGAYNGSVDTSTGGVFSQTPTGSNANEPPLDVRRYIEAHPGAPPVGGGSLGVGDMVPNDAVVRSVPGYPQWGYSSNGDQNVIVNRDTGTVAGTVSNK